MLSFFENLKSLFNKKNEQPAEVAAPITVIEPVIDEPEDETPWPWTFGIDENGQAQIFRRDEQDNQVQPPSDNKFQRRPG